MTLKAACPGFGLGRIDARRAWESGARPAPGRRALIRLGRDPTFDFVGHIDYFILSPPTFRTSGCRVESPLSILAAAGTFLIDFSASRRRPFRVSSNTIIDPSDTRLANATLSGSLRISGRRAMSSGVIGSCEVAPKNWTGG
jgi:hypothetical protein